jgi:hypothetical protein
MHRSAFCWPCITRFSAAHDGGGDAATPPGTGQTKTARLGAPAGRAHVVRGKERDPRSRTHWPAKRPALMNSPRSPENRFPSARSTPCRRDSPARNAHAHKSALRKRSINRWRVMGMAMRSTKILPAARTPHHEGVDRVRSLSGPGTTQAIRAAQRASLASRGPLSVFSTESDPGDNRQAALRADAFRSVRQIIVTTRSRTRKSPMERLTPCAWRNSAGTAICD